jgi:hypothetical protein
LPTGIIGHQLLNASAVYEAQPRGTSAAHGGVAAAHTIHSLHSRAARFTHQREYLVRLRGRLLRLQWHSLTRRGKGQGEGNGDQSRHLFSPGSLSERINEAKLAANREASTLHRSSPFIQ